MKTKISNLALINVEELDKRVEELSFDNTSDIYEYYLNLREKKVLDTIKQSLIPATKLAEQAFDAGLKRGYSGYPNTDNFTKPNKEEFLNLEIQL